MHLPIPWNKSWDGYAKDSLLAFRCQFTIKPYMRCWIWIATPGESGVSVYGGEGNAGGAMGASERVIGLTIGWGLTSAPPLWSTAIGLVIGEVIRLKGAKPEAACSPPISNSNQALSVSSNSLINGSPFTAGTIRVLHGFPPSLRRTMTADNGVELAQFRRLEPP